MDSSSALFLNSATYLTIPFENPKVENDLAELTKSRKFPTKAIPSVPIKMAIALEVKKPEIILIKTATELIEAILIKILFLRFLINVLNKIDVSKFNLVFFTSDPHPSALQTTNC